MGFKPFKELSEQRQLKLVSNMMECNSYWQDYIIDELTNELNSYGFIDINIDYTGFNNQGDGASFTASYVDIYKFVEKNKDNLNFSFEDGTIINNEDKLDALLEMALEDLVEDNGDDKTIAEQLIKHGFLYARVIRNNHRYYHEHTVSCDIEDEYCEVVDTEEEVDVQIYHINSNTYNVIMNFKEYLQEYMNEWVICKCKEMYRRIEQEWETANKAEYESLMEQNEIYYEEQVY